jgi:ech hydrogenase subunit A
MESVALLVFIPIVTALFIPFIPRISVQYFLITLTAVALASISVVLFLTPIEPRIYSFNDTSKMLIIIFDIVLLLFFIQQGFRFKSFKVTILALLQLLLLIGIEFSLETTTGSMIIVDKLSILMFLIINVVGGSIIIYALKYMQSEDTTPFKRALFISYLLIFIAIMNLIVMANSLLLFFFLFEMTTLASYLLIGFRKDPTALNNAIQALWMNQIGGVTILLAALIASLQFHTIYLDSLLTHSGSFLLLAMALLSMAAFVKAASLPFNPWLLGAMVAPTPVSAMLHSATMVKIAPYLMLKIAPALATSLLGMSVSIISALVFVFASYLALSRCMIKEILGYSTIALLGLMMSLAAMGTKESMTLAAMLMLFHAFSKAILFLSAGMIEKNLHFKDILEMQSLREKSSRTVFYIMFGFISLTLPPFGLFMGKLFAIETISEALFEQPWLIIILTAIIIGSALLVLLYFKVASALFSSSSDIKAAKKEPFSFAFELPILLLIALSLILPLDFLIKKADLSMSFLALPIVLFFLIPWFVNLMQKFDRTKPYHCAEDEAFSAALFFFQPSPKVHKLILLSFTLMFLFIPLIGLLS